jgi:hypothetical protein
MKRYEDDNFDQYGILRDGAVARVPMMMRDALTSGHRPGFRLGDADMRDAKQRARDAYETDLTNAWRDGGRKITQRNPQGRLMSVLEEEEEDVTDAMPPVRDGRTLDQIRHDHQERMTRLYAQYDAEQRDEWRMR